METKQPTPIKADLFRFITLRTPQLISESRKKLRFITHPNPLKSFFLNGLDENNLDQSRATMRTLAGSFKPVVLKLQELKDSYPSLYTFSAWLIKNRNTLTDTEVKVMIADVPLLEGGELYTIWDNLLYQTLKRNNPTVRQGCIQLLIAHHFLTTVTTSDYTSLAAVLVQTPKYPSPPAIADQINLLLQLLAKARVMIPKAFTVNKQSTNEDSLPNTKVSSGQRELNNSHLKMKYAYNIEGYQKIKSEIRTGMGLAGPGSKDLSILMDKKSSISQTLSKETLNYLKKNSVKSMSLSMAETVLNEKIKEATRKSSRILSRKSVNKYKKGNKKSTKTEPYSFAVSIDKLNHQHEILMTMDVGYAGAYITSSDYEIIFEGSSAIKSNTVTEVASDNKKLLMLHLLPDQDIELANETLFQLKGSYTLSNGINVAFDTKGSLNSPVTSGTGKIQTSSSFGPSPSPSAGMLYGVNRLGIGVYRKVEQEVCCYVPGEVSRIENIMAREYKERHTRSLISTETTEEDTTEIEVEAQNDTVSTNRNELQSEISNELTKDTSIGVGASLGVSGSYAGVTVSADGSFDFASSSSSTSSDSEAATYAQEVTNNALERVLQKTTQKRTSKMLEEYEENNRHGYDNREGTEHVTGVYRWIDIIYTNRLINYGKRLMIEFLIPEPARFYREALKKKAEAATGTGSDNEMEAPIHPSEYGINAATDITEDNYLELGRAYDITLDEPITPVEETITESFVPKDDPNGDADPNAKENSYSFSLNFYASGQDLSMYSAYEATASYSFDYHLGDGTFGYEMGTYFKLKVYEDSVSYDKDTLNTSDSNDEVGSNTKTGTKIISLPNLKTEIPVSVQIKNVYDFTINLSVKLILDPEEITNWQNTAYDKIMQAYESEVASYEAEIAALEDEAAAAEEEQAENTGSDFNRTVEQREIQRIAIEMLTKPFGIPQGRDFYEYGACDIPQVKQTRLWETYSSHVKFFEQAFDWSLMAYLFYPYYWASKCSWVDLMQTTNADDPIFEAFLQSGMARVVIPVRKGFEEAVDYYMETGDIWNGGGLVIDADDDLYVSIDEELMDIEGFVDKEWKTRVPTTLTIIQGNSVYLEDEGLPCCHKVEEGDVDTLLRGSDTILGDILTDDTTIDDTTVVTP